MNAADPATRKFFATCPKGLEYLLVDELKALGAGDAHEALAGVHFGGSLDAGYRACLWSRLASRVLMPIAEFAAADGDALYRGALDVDWSEHFGTSDTFAVDAVGSTQGITHTQFAALRVKDAIVDQFRERGGVRPSVDTERPSLRVNLVLRKGQAILSIDLAGTPLHQRGYRLGKGLAPLKENLAAGMLLRAGWPATYAAGGGLVDPMCGSGTIPIEAVLLARAAPRPTPALHALGLAAGPAEPLYDATPLVVGCDVELDVLAAARDNARAAKIGDAVVWQRCDVADLRPDMIAQIALERGRPAPETGLLLANPPYGERLDDQDLEVLYRVIAETCRRFRGWRAGFLVGNPLLEREFMRYLGRPRIKKPLANANLRAYFYLYDL